MKSCYQEQFNPLIVRTNFAPESSVCATPSKQELAVRIELANDTSIIHEKAQRSLALRVSKTLNDNEDEVRLSSSKDELLAIMSKSNIDIRQRIEADMPVLGLEAIQDSMTSVEKDALDLLFCQLTSEVSPIEKQSLYSELAEKVSLITTDSELLYVFVGEVIVGLGEGFSKKVDARGVFKDLSYSPSTRSWKMRCAEDYCNKTITFLNHELAGVVAWTESTNHTCFVYIHDYCRIETPWQGRKAESDLMRSFWDCQISIELGHDPNQMSGIARWGDLKSCITPITFKLRGQTFKCKLSAETLFEMYEKECEKPVYKKTQNQRYEQKLDELNPAHSNSNELRVRD